MSKILKDDALSIGLLLIYEATNGMQILVSEDTLNEFYLTMEQNLIEMNSDDVFAYGLRYEEEPIYTISQDEKGITYYILKNNFDLEKAKHNYIGIVPFNYIVAAEKENALSILGLTINNGKIVKKESSSLIAMSKFIQKLKNGDLSNYNKLLEMGLLNDLEEKGPKLIKNSKYH